MLNIKDEDFDNLIRKAVEDQPVKFEPAHWQKMEQKLDMARVRKTYNRNIGTSALILTFLWSLVMFWLYINHEIRSKELDQKGTVVAGIERQEVIKQEAFPDYLREKADPLPEISASPDAAWVARLQPGPENFPEDREQKPRETAGREPDAFSKNSGSPARGALKSGNGLPYGAGAAVRASGRYQGPAGATNGRNTTVRYLERMPADIVHPVLSVPDLFSMDEKALPAEKAVDSKKNNRVAGLYVSVNAAANLSSVGFSKMAPPGFDGGVTFEYFLGEKVSVVTGALYSTKKYSMDEEGFQSASNAYYSETIHQVDGRCAVLDIPLNLRYYFISSKKHLFFLSSGMSSYLMLNEAYDLYATDYYGEETIKTKKLSNENRHIFGIVNFSFGYERVLSRQFSLQVAPFVKMPVTDIGDYKIGLTSAGAFFSLKYRLR